MRHLDSCIRASMVLGAATWLAVACPVRGDDVPAAPTDVVATVGDAPIFRSELDAVVRRAAQLKLDGLNGAGGGPDAARSLEALAIEQLVDERLLRAEIQREQIKIGALEISTRLDQLKKQVAARGMDWRQFLEQTGREESALRGQIELEIGLDKLIRPKLTQAAIASGYERHRREIDGTRLRVSHIVLRPDAALGDEGLAATTARAAAIRREIVQGMMSFADAAKRHSVGPSRFRGGDLGWITREAPCIDAFSKQAYALAKGDVSKPFITPFGVHVVQVTGIEPGRAGLDVLRPKVESLLAAQMLRETLVKLRASTPVSFAAGVAHFDPATPPDGSGPRRIVVGDPPGSGPEGARP